MSDHDATELSEAEGLFLCRVAEDGILAFQPRLDRMIAGLLERGFLIAEAQLDPDYERVSLTAKGRAAVALIRESRS